MATQQFSREECEKFEDEANPHRWFLSASLLHDQAVELRARREEGKFIEFASTKRTEWHATNKATFLLCALALENAIKAFLIYEHSEWVSGGRLHHEICNHKLVSLSGKSTLIPYARRDAWVLAAFEEGNESWMRYPCARRVSDVRAEPQLQEQLWNAYRRVMRGYGLKLFRLFRKGWRGRHGFDGSWRTTGSWLGAEAKDYIPPNPGKPINFIARTQAYKPS
jgi:hypothetical protein